LAGRKALTKDLELELTLPAFIYPSPERSEGRRVKMNEIHRLPER